jgi:hypothetical protein
LSISSVLKLWPLVFHNAASSVVHELMPPLRRQQNPAGQCSHTLAHTHTHMSAFSSRATEDTVAPHHLGKKETAMGLRVQTLF